MENTFKRRALQDFSAIAFATLWNERDRDISTLRDRECKENRHKLVRPSGYVTNLGVGDQQIITNNLNTVSTLGGHLSIVLPVILVKWVLNGHDWVLSNKGLVKVLESISRNLLRTIVVLQRHKQRNIL